MTSAEVAWSFYNAIESGEIPTGLALIAPDCAWTEMDRMAVPGTFHGPDAISRASSPGSGRSGTGSR